MVLGEPSHRFCGAGGVQEGSPNSIQCLTCIMRGQGESSLIGRVKGRFRVNPICLWGIGCGGGTIDNDQEMGVVQG